MNPEKADVMADREQGKEKKSKSSKAECCGYPLSIFFIVVNEFCERFSYYGMRAVLVLYFRYFLRWDDDLATTIYHTFVALCYLTPILGAIVADSWLGKFKTIVYLSIVYTIGQVVMAVSAVHDITDTNQDGTPDNMTFHVALSMVGLFLIAVGTGGIKPCVAAFGGDQFGDHQDKQRSTFFSIFYLSINAGSLLSTVITPILRAQECGINSQQKCYPLAFGVPAALMAVALIVFIAGSGMYTKAAPKGNIMMEVCKCIGFAIKNRFRHRSSAYPKREHWMDWANEKYDKLLIAQVKMVLKVLFLYIPLPMFWALFDQQGSRWTLQATTMDGNFGGFVVQPDQMQTVNPILILVMVPIVDSVVYPLIKKCGLNFTPLKRMTVGMFMAGLAFVAAALVQIQIDQTLPKFPSHTEAQVKFLNMENNPLSVSVDGTPFDIQAFQSSGNYLNLNMETATVAVNGNEFAVSLIKGRRQTVLLSSTGILGSSQDLNTKPEQGNNDIRFVNGFGTVLNVTGAKDLGAVTPNNFSDYGLIPQGKAIFTILNDEGQTCNYSITLGFGSSYTLVIPSTFSFGPNCWTTIQQIEDIKPNTIHMAWQIPQYFLMTSGEVVFSVTGLEFSYSQAPSNMKSVLQAGWLLTVAVGNIIVLIVAEAGQLPDQWAEYVLFASLLVCVCIIFSIMAYFYTYIDPAEIEAKFTEQNPEDKEEKKKGLELGNMYSLAAEKSEQVKQTKI
ncbi:solute carrier family 15 member 1b [Colossoma macropomum]|uniref:solute carrier family 15 member 1b n=1 Tax=Colossoma macropomum TaxID=42526 RepID=UPI001865624E|nr:solute carrier family 15 member 1b [Colossoma macropomum]